MRRREDASRSAGRTDSTSPADSALEEDRRELPDRPDLNRLRRQARARRTSFVIADRLSTVLAADRILVLDRGRLVDSGAHEELLERGGLDKTLYERQFRAGGPSQGGVGPQAGVGGGFCLPRE